MKSNSLQDLGAIRQKINDAAQAAAAAEQARLEAERRAEARARRRGLGSAPLLPGDGARDAEPRYDADSVFAKLKPLKRGQQDEE